ncbi:F-box domain-containing protein [Diaporthe helianthi]|uniref:F-box domain-containing protein n=1 Tax=Diaporthe helianthi TaxID=158607 RepID=A0A2P5HQU9_DIAHE|nr:F-box domain-containing protein [Diaporthe helianthi]
METANIHALPAEMLSHIFLFLDSPAPSDERLHDQPHAHMLKQPDLSAQNLKIISVVNKKWRATVLPLLFRNTICYLDQSDLSLVDLEQSNGPHSLTPLLSFIRDNSLTPYVKSLTLVVVKSTRVRSTNAGAVDSSRAGDNGYSPDPFGPLSRGGRERDMVFNEDSNWLWNLIFDLIDPLRFTIIASPRSLASLLARMLFLGDAWSFYQSHHVLSLSRNSKPAASPNEELGVASVQQETGLSASIAPRVTGQSSSTSAPVPPQARRIPCFLFTVRPWDALLLNEGSSTRVYKTYEYYHRRPPSMLGALLGAEEFPNDEPLIPSTIRDLSYVGIFPLSTHFNTLVQNLPRIDRLFVQLVPRNDILKDKKEMEHLDMDDLWAERNTSYSKIMPKLFDSSSSAGNWRYLQVFESGDAADRESWDMAVEYVGHFSTEWRVESEGVFVKRQQGEDENGANAMGASHAHGDGEDIEGGSGSDEDGPDGPGPVFFRGALHRFAFAGVTLLPLSSVWLYLQHTDP